jgi:uncharacterized protein DUF6600/FecR-like protein
MSSSSRLYASILLLLLTIFSAPLTVRAFDDEADEYDVKARVVRISLIAGEVSLKRKGNTDWERARLNFPLVEGDTVSTDRNSRLEIQFDARNFVRLAENTTLQIVTLRDEGVALSIGEGTATIRLAKFDRQHEYFEIDAPRTTMAAEKKGIYRIDVPRDGRVRLSVRDGGSARIYSDTSGFALRDGRTAELILTGDNAGDWEFIATSPRDAIDDWVDERERYLAQRLRYDVQYYDQYVWGAEDLDAYGDWSYTTDYGWLWSPHSSAINVYVDWAPYRHGRWVWCAPYGWTWVGYEPWGWAPYHYGRWVFYRGRWAWCPRSAYYRNYSWWRPALVAVVHISDNYCWYPLGYYQRDPHSRHYNPGRYTPDPRHINTHHVPGVTWCDPRRIGHDDMRPRRADEKLARQVIRVQPIRTELPENRPIVDGTARGGPGGRPGRFGSQPPPSTGSTGAANRTPGVALDDELRRTRVLNGRDPRPVAPGVDTTLGGTNETRPTGAVGRPVRAPRETLGDGERNPGTGVDERRPERRPAVTPTNPGSETPNDERRPERRPPASPGNDITRPPRSEEPANLDPGEKPMRGRERIEPVRPERRTDPATPTVETLPQRSDPQPRVEPPQRSERPERSEAPQRSERPQRSEPPQRSEAPQRNEPPQRSEPPQRTEAPRSEPRSEPPQRTEAPRSEPRSEPPQRTEAPRSEPRSEPPQRTEAPRSEPRSEAPSRPSRPDNYERPSRSESPRSESPRSESPRSEPPRSESPRSEPPRSEPPRSEPPRSEPRSEPARDPDSGRPSKPDKPAAEPEQE